MKVQEKKTRMYTPENHRQMFEILGALRSYAGAHSMVGLAEMLDDALVFLAEEGREELARLPQDEPRKGVSPEGVGG